MVFKLIFPVSASVRTRPHRLLGIPYLCKVIRLQKEADGTRTTRVGRMKDGFFIFFNPY